MPNRKRLSRDDWAAAALDALGTGGLAAVAVEPIAARLGATKGSFYWHFRNRDALVEAALELWEQRYTAEVIELVEAAPDAREALRTLMFVVLGAAGDPGRDPASRQSNAVEVALQAEHDHPLVGPALERVARRRIGHLRTMFADLGFGPADAEQRALTAFLVYLGQVRLAHATPDLVPRGPALTAHLDGMLAMITSGTSTP